MKRWWMTTCACLLAGTVGCGFFSKNLGPLPGEDQNERAGCPREVSPCAHPSETCAYVVYPVGGGEAIRHKGRLPGPDDGVIDGHISGLTAAVSPSDSPLTSITDNRFEYGVDYLGYWLRQAAESWARPG